MSKLDHRKLSIKERIARESLEFAKSISRTDQETEEDVKRDVTTILEFAYESNFRAFLDIGFVAIEFYAHYRIPYKKALVMARRIADNMGVLAYDVGE